MARRDSREVYAANFLTTRALRRDSPRGQSAREFLPRRLETCARIPPAETRDVRHEFLVARDLRRDSSRRVARDDRPHDDRRAQESEQRRSRPAPRNSSRGDSTCTPRILSSSRSTPRIPHAVLRETIDRTMTAELKSQNRGDRDLRREIPHVETRIPRRSSRSTPRRELRANPHVETPHLRRESVARDLGANHSRGDSRSPRIPRSSRSRARAGARDASLRRADVRAARGCTGWWRSTRVGDRSPPRGLPSGQRRARSARSARTLREFLTRGIPLWQDLMVANMDYPEDAAFTDKVKFEIEGRPSLAVICGNSDGERQVDSRSPHVEPRVLRREFLTWRLEIREALTWSLAFYGPNSSRGDSRSTPQIPELEISPRILDWRSTRLGASTTSGRTSGDTPLIERLKVERSRPAVLDDDRRDLRSDREQHQVATCEQ